MCCCERCLTLVYDVSAMKCPDMKSLSIHWPRPPQVKVCISTRQQGLSEAGYWSANLADHVGDCPEAVATNRRAFEACVGVPVTWLKQVHSKHIVEILDGLPNTVPEADGSITSLSHRACAVLTADCLPVLICDKQAQCVAAVHAGWRGLAAGILSAAVQAFAYPVEELSVYLGPAISQLHFEVGEELVDAFTKAARERGFEKTLASDFVLPQASNKFKLDLYAVARAELEALGVMAIYGGEYCTYAQKEQFYSYRRDKITGRFASAIWIEP